MPAVLPPLPDLDSPANQPPPFSWFQMFVAYTTVLLLLYIAWRLAAYL